MKLIGGSFGKSGTVKVDESGAIVIRGRMEAYYAASDIATLLQERSRPKLLPTLLYTLGLWPLLIFGIDYLLASLGVEGGGGVGRLHGHTSIASISFLVAIPVAAFLSRQQTLTASFSDGSFVEFLPFSSRERSLVEQRVKRSAEVIVRRREPLPPGVNPSVVKRITSQMTPGVLRVVFAWVIPAWLLSSILAGIFESLSQSDMPARQSIDSFLHAFIVTEIVLVLSTLYRKRRKIQHRIHAQIAQIGRQMTPACFMVGNSALAISADGCELVAVGCHGEACDKAEVRRYPTSRLVNAEAFAPGVALERTPVMAAGGTGAAGIGLAGAAATTTAMMAVATGMKNSRRKRNAEAATGLYLTWAGEPQTQSFVRMDYAAAQMWIQEFQRLQAGEPCDGVWRHVPPV